MHGSCSKQQGKIPIPQEMNVKNPLKCANCGVDKGVTRSIAMLRLFWSRPRGGRGGGGGGGALINAS